MSKQCGDVDLNKRYYNYSHTAPSCSCAKKSTFSCKHIPKQDLLSTELEPEFVSDRVLTLLSLSSAVRGTLTRTVPVPSAEANNGDDDSLEKPAGWPVPKGEQNSNHTKGPFSVLKAS